MKTLLSLLSVSSVSGAAMACPKCRTLVQSGIHNADFAPHFALMIFPLALIVGVALAVYRLK